MSEFTNYTKSGDGEVADCFGVYGNGFVCFNPVYSLQLDKETSDSAELVKQSRRQCRPLFAFDALFCCSYMDYGDSTRKQFEAHAQLLPRVSLEEVAMDF